MTGKQIEIAADDGSFDAYLAAPDKGKGPGGDEPGRSSLLGEIIGSLYHLP